MSMRKVLAVVLHVTFLLIMVIAGVSSSANEASSAAGSIAASGELSARSISWWWTGMHMNATAPEVEGLLSFCREHRDIVTTVIMRCGVLTCCRTGTGDCGNNALEHRTGGCTNNHGHGGTIAGQVSGACKAVIPQLVQMGIRPEIWLGEDDSLTSARFLFNSSAQIASALSRVATDYPGIAGFNLDLETKLGTAQDKRDFVSFLGTVTKALNPALRFSADVGCVALDEGGGPLASDCKALSVSGVNRLMNMVTYNAASYAEWYGILLSAVQTVPLNVLSTGLGCWTDSQLKGSWSLTAKSAEQRICALMNQSVQEISMYDLQQPGPGIPAGGASAPEPFWIG